MYKTFQIQHFRGFEQFQLKDLRRINVIGGLNNIGKTCLLEAIFIHSGFGNAELLVRTNFWRGLLPIATSAQSAVKDFIGASFYQYDTITPFVLESVDDVGKKRRTKVTAATEWETQVTSTMGTEKTTGEQQMGLTLNLGKLTFEEDGALTQEHNILLQTAKGQMSVRVEPSPKPGAFPCNFLHTRQPYIHAEDANIYSMLRRDGKDELVLEALRAIDTTIEGIEVLSPGGTPIMFVRRSKGIKLLPLPLLGDGAVRLVNYILKMAQSSLGIILIDEFGFDFHYSVLPGVWEVIHKSANLFQTQVICTTHSLETVESAYLKFTQQQVINDFQYIRLEKTNDHVDGVVYDPESLRLAIEKRFEVR